MSDVSMQSVAWRSPPHDLSSLASSTFHCTMVFQLLSGFPPEPLERMTSAVLVGMLSNA